MALIGSCQRIDEGEVDDFSDAAEKMILGDKIIQAELIVELWSEPALTHHGLLPPFWGQAARTNHITNEVRRRLRQQSLQKWDISALKRMDTSRLEVPLPDASIIVLSCF